MSTYKLEFKSFQYGEAEQNSCTCRCFRTLKEQENEYETMNSGEYEYEEDAYVDYGKYGETIGDGDLAEYPEFFEYEVDRRLESPPMLLQGACEKTCLKLNLLHDGGFDPPCDETTAYDFFPYCDGDPAKDDRFHMRQCIMTCRQPEDDETCPQMHRRGNDLRGCEAGIAFRQGLPYEFVTREGESVVFQSLVSIVPTQRPSNLPTELVTTVIPTTVPSQSPSAVPTQSPSLLNESVTPVPTQSPSLLNESVTPVPSLRNATVPSQMPSQMPSFSPRNKADNQIDVILGIVFGTIFILIIAFILAIFARRYVNRRREQLERDASAAQRVERVIDEVNETFGQETNH